MKNAVVTGRAAGAAAGEPADVSIGVNVPGLSLHIGDRDNRATTGTAIAGAIRAGGPITTGMNARAGTIMARRHG